jgi:hypothetical protein
MPSLLAGQWGKPLILVIENPDFQLRNWMRAIRRQGHHGPAFSSRNLNILCSFLILSNYRILLRLSKNLGNHNSEAFYDS